MQINLEPVTQLAEQICSPLGLSVVAIRIAQQGKNRSLEVTIFRRGGRVSLQDCEEVSRQLDKLLDESDPPAVAGSYLLEVQSPGLDRKLATKREYDIFVGEEIEVKTRKPLAPFGDKFTGILKGCSGESITLDKPKKAAAEGRKGGKRKTGTEASDQLPGEIEVELSTIISARLHFDVTKKIAETQGADLVLAE